MRIDKPLRISLAVALAAVSLAACDRETQRTTGQKLDNAVERTKEDLARAGDKVKPTLEKAGDEIKQAGKDLNAQIKPALDRAGEKIANSDAAITTSINADYLKDPSLSVLKIDVDTRDGVVVLNGVTATPAARDRAEQLALGVKGVKQVKNHLTVKQG